MTEKRNFINFTRYTIIATSVHSRYVDKIKVGTSHVLKFSSDFLFSSSFFYRVWTCSNAKIVNYLRYTHTTHFCWSTWFIFEMSPWHYQINPEIVRVLPMPNLLLIIFYAHLIFFLTSCIFFAYFTNYWKFNFFFFNQKLFYLKKKSREKEIRLVALTNRHLMMLCSMT